MRDAKIRVRPGTKEEEDDNDAREPERKNMRRSVRQYKTTPGIMPTPSCALTDEGSISYPTRKQ